MDLIGQIRRAFFEQRRPIKEIVRTLSVSRSTMRKVIRSQGNRVQVRAWHPAGAEARRGLSTKKEAAALEGKLT